MKQVAGVQCILCVVRNNLFHSFFGISTWLNMVSVVVHM